MALNNDDGDDVVSRLLNDRRLMCLWHCHQRFLASESSDLYRHDRIVLMCPLLAYYMLSLDSHSTCSQLVNPC